MERHVYLRTVYSLSQYNKNPTPCVSSTKQPLSLSIFIVAMIQLKIRLLGVKQQSTIQRIFYNDDVLKLFVRKFAALIISFHEYSPLRKECLFNSPKTFHIINLIHFVPLQNMLSFYLVSYYGHSHFNKTTKELHPKLNLT